MFHWICPECGREIAPQARECAACDPSAPAPPTPAESVPAEPMKLLSAPADAPPDSDAAPLQPRVSGAPKPPASAIPKPLPPAGRDLSPVEPLPVTAQTPAWGQTLPELEPARAPRIATAAFREPQPANPPAALSPRALTQAAEPIPAPTSLPSLERPDPPAPPIGGPVNYAAVAASRIQPARGKSTPAASSVNEQLSLPGPTLPHELTSLHAAGVAKILVASGQPVPARSSSWVLSFVVAAAVLAATLGFTFYAMPGFANSSAPKGDVDKQIKSDPPPEQPSAPTNPLARVVEVTGIRFVTDIPGRPPQIHYLVVNHSNVPLIGVKVSVTLRAAGSADGSPLSQFGFSAPRLGPYESKEMVSSIERFNRPVALPDWRELKADVQIVQ